MAAITISRQLGSPGIQIAHEVGQRLGYRVVWREIISQAAREAGAPEVALATIDDLGLSRLRLSRKARQAYHRAVRRVVEELVAEGDVVIVGRAGQVILRNHPDVLHVKILAPPPSRIKQLVSTQNISIDDARAQVEGSDRARQSYLRRYYHARWDDPELYDLIINTERLTTDSAADLVCLALTRLQAVDPNTAQESERRFE